MPDKSFSGFPGNPEVVPIPALFFKSLLPMISDIAELKTVLHIFNVLSKRRGYPRFMSYEELFNDKQLKDIIALDSAEPFEETLKSALSQAVNHAILLQQKIEKNNKLEDIYLINGDSERKAIDKIINGEIKVVDFNIVKPIEEQPETIANIFSLYEENIGILTPIIAEQLHEAEKEYPSDWIQNAFKEAVTANKRNWKYIARILERWAVEGKDNGEIGRNNKKENDPDRYIKGKYGHMVNR
jgi:DNA replication protein